MANWYCDSKDGNDGNGGTSWVDAVETIAQLETLGGVGDYYYVLGHGDDYPYNLSANLSAVNRHWRGVKQAGRWKPPWGGWPKFLFSGSQAYDGPLNPYSVKDFFMKNADIGVSNLRSSGDENVVERCVFEDCEDGMRLGNASGLIARYNLMFGTGQDYGIYVRMAEPAGLTNIEVHHNTCIGGTRGIGTVATGTSGALSFDAFHSNILKDCTTGIEFDPDGGLAFTGSGEPNYNCYHNNTTDLDDGGHGVSKGANAINADPNFLKAASDDYRLQPGSPCLRAADSSSNCGVLGPGMTMARRMRRGAFFADPGYYVNESESEWRDEHLVGT